MSVGGPYPERSERERGKETAFSPTLFTFSPTSLLRNPAYEITFPATEPKIVDNSLFNCHGLIQHFASEWWQKKELMAKFIS